MAANTTLLWYDYETWGASPMKDSIAQFAAVRTNLDLEIIDEPIDIFCRPNIDTLIEPDAVNVTGLSPIQLQQQGMSEWQFAQQIHQQMIQSGTCTVGYNSIRFDDECTRYLFYRNLLDPYAREWKNGNSRWDIMDMVRMTKALRPEGIEWPVREDGFASFKLEHLTQANGISHENAHDAVSDVKATIAMAKLIKQRQPKLYDYAFSLRYKREVLKYLDVMHHTPHLHFTGKIPAQEHCLGIEIPLMIHPDRSNEVIVIDIREDPSWVLDYNAEQLQQWLYTATSELPEGVQRPPFKTIHINRSPMVAPISLLDAETANRLGISLAKIDQHRAWVAQHPDVLKLALDVFTDKHEREQASNPEYALYSGFIDDHDRAILNRFTEAKEPEERWLSEADALHDKRLPELVTNVLARHFPEALSPQQNEAWREQRINYLEECDADQTETRFEQLLAKARLINEADPNNQAIADTLQYLEAFEQRWFDTKPAAEPLVDEIDDAENTAPNQQVTETETETEIKTKTDTETKPEGDEQGQLDLF